MRFKSVFCFKKMISILVVVLLASICSAEVSVKIVASTTWSHPETNRIVMNPKRPESLLLRISGVKGRGTIREIILRKSKAFMKDNQDSIVFDRSDLEREVLPDPKIRMLEPSLNIDTSSPHYEIAFSAPLPKRPSEGEYTIGVVIQSFWGSKTVHFARHPITFDTDAGRSTPPSIVFLSNPQSVNPKLRNILSAIQEENRQNNAPHRQITDGTSVIGIDGDVFPKNGGRQRPLRDGTTVIGIDDRIYQRKYAPQRLDLDTTVIGIDGQQNPKRYT